MNFSVLGDTVVSIVVARVLGLVVAVEPTSAWRLEVVLASPLTLSTGLVMAVKLVVAMVRLVVLELLTVLILVLVTVLVAALELMEVL